LGKPFPQKGFPKKKTPPQKNQKYFKLTIEKSSKKLYNIRKKND